MVVYPILDNISDRYSIRDRIHYGRLFIGSKNKLVQRVFYSSKLLPFRKQQHWLFPHLIELSHEVTNQSIGDILGSVAEWVEHRAHSDTVIL